MTHLFAKMNRLWHLSGETPKAVKAQQACICPSSAWTHQYTRSGAARLPSHRLATAHPPSSSRRSCSACASRRYQATFASHAQNQFTARLRTVPY